MLSPYRKPPPFKKNQRKQKTPNTSLDDVKVTSNDLKMTSNNLKTTSNEPLKKKKDNLKGCSNLEINEKYPDENVPDIYV